MIKNVLCHYCKPQYGIKFLIFRALLSLILISSIAAWVGAQAPTYAVNLISQIGPWDAWDVRVVAHYAYVATWSGLHIVDISDPVHPTEIAFYETSVRAYGLDISGTYAYLAVDSGLQIVDISNPSSPIEVGVGCAGCRLGNVVVRGDYAYAVGIDLHIIDISNPAHPTEIGTYAPPQEPALGMTDIAVVGDYAYLPLHTGALWVVDISNPVFPQKVGSWEASQGHFTGISVAGDYAYLSNFAAGSALHVLNISNPTHIVEVGTYYDGHDEAFDVAVKENLAYLNLDCNKGLLILDVTNASLPTKVGLYEEHSYCGGRHLTVEGNYVYRADREYGLLIYTRTESASINFPDPNLEQAIRDAIGIPTGDIHETDLIGLTSLDAASREIADLEGMQYCKDLTWLYLDHNQISNIAPLSGLTNLTWLLLNDNQISDITPLAGLTNLTELSLNHNQIRDISPLSGLTNVMELNLGNNQISDIAPLSGLTNLTELYLELNQIVDISDLSGLTNLTELWLSDNQIIDINPLSGLTNLRNLCLEDNQIVDISVLAGLTNLTELWLSDNQIVDISLLASLTNLITLYLGTNQISNIAPLAGLASLTSLGLGDNQISDIASLSGLVNLDALWLDGNQVSIIECLSKLTVLRLLFVTNNQISDITPLAGLTNLVQLYLDHNMLNDIQALVDNSGLGVGDEVNVRYNYLDLAAGADDMQNIQALIARGIDVEYEPQDTPENQPPDTAVVSASISGNTATFNWSGSDDTTPATQLTYSYRLVRPGPAYDAWSSWSSEKTKKYTDLSPGNYKFQVRARDAQKLIDPSPASKEFAIEETENHSPIARASDISGQPKGMYPDTIYTVTAEYFDPDGRTDLKYCYLRLKHPTKPLTMMWYQADGHAAPWAGEEGEDYLSNVNVTATNITDGDSNEGYELTWTFQISEQWPEVENAIDFGVFASDDGDLESGWDYDDMNASFKLMSLDISSPLKISPVQNIYSVGDQVIATFTVKNRGRVPISLDVLTVGGRLNGACLPEGCPDFTHSYITLSAGESYQYQGNLTLNHAGVYHFFCAYKSHDSWNTNIDVELNGQIVEDFAVARRCREADVRVVEGATVSTALGPTSWEPIKGPWDKWPEDKFGSSWNIIQAIAVNPQDPNEIYVAATHRTNNFGESEGSRLYKSVDGGENWSDISDGLPHLHSSSYYRPIAAIAIAPSNPNVVYVGTTDFSPHNVDILAGPSHGMGVYKTINGGQSWFEWNSGSQLSPPSGSTPPMIISSFPTVYSVSSMIVDPTNADIVYAGTVLGGIWSTVKVSGEIGWQQVWKPVGQLCYDVNSLAISPDDPSTIYAAAYNYVPYSGGTISGLVFQGGLYKCTNTECPKIYGERRVDDIAISTGTTKNIYIITNKYGAFRSVNGGIAWQDISGKGEDSLPQVHLDPPYTRPSYSLEMDPNSRWLFAASPWETQALGVYFSPNLGENWFPIGLQDENVQQLASASTSEQHILYAVTAWSTKEVHLFKYDFSSSAVVVERGSPVEIRVYDTDGNVTGVVAGQQRAEIPKSSLVGETVTILSSTGPYDYKVFGTGKGTYDLKISAIYNNYVTTAVATDIPTCSGAIHQYTIDWDALARGEEGVTLEIDNDGDGIVDRTVSTGDTLTGGNFGVIPTRESVNLGPNPVTGTGTAFFYTLPDGISTAKLMIFNVAGRPVFEASLDANSTRFPDAGTWNPVDQDGVLLANGPYMYVLIADGKVIGKGKMVIQR